MEISGLGTNYIPVNQEKSFQSKSESGFSQVLNKVADKNNSKQPVDSNEKSNETKASKDVLLLLFLKKTDIKDVTKGNQAVDGNSLNTQPERLQLVKNLLGISDQKWAEIIAQLEANAKDKLKDNDPLSLFTEGLSFLTMNPSIAGLSDNMNLFVKAAKVFSLLSNQDGSGQKFLAGLLDSVKDQLQSAVPNEKAQSKLTYLQNTFSQAVSDMKEQTTGTNQTNRLKAVDRLTDWNATSPFLQQMSKPEQLVVMGGGNAKSVSVNDLIQQFDSILSKSQFSKMGGVQRLFIKLNPEHLGSISIELIRKDQAITARILTSTSAAKEALESHLHNLKQAFEAQSIKVDNVEIGQQSAQSQQDNFLNHEQRDQQENPQEQGQNADNEDSDSNFILTLEEAILNQKV